ncbi:hypothetical protein [Streptomyces sp. NBC_00582]|uniref:hypothetical protein n=1 Tax=Streptomyces sp. NBC_00582 TaxID=2975783 RepID=UPI002E801EFE|nr:hypothetical protein [Streptomyces sp. NBC_00582]WUB62820.1 hypothetical protein OG852_21665 [Streptomyces sp. NBC_00582]
MGSRESVTGAGDTGTRDAAMESFEEFQKNAVQVIEGDSRKLSSVKDGMAMFVDSKPGKRGERFRFVPVASLSIVADDLVNGAVEHSEYAGFLLPGRGYAEFTVRPSRSMPLRRYIERLKWVSDDAECSHAFIPSEPTRPNGREAESSRIGFHVHSPKERACVELSRATATATFLTDPWPFVTAYPENSLRMYTLKVFVEPSLDGESVSRQATDIAARSIFELDIRNGIHFVLEPRERLRVSFEASPGSNSPKIRFPRLKTPREVAALFSFAAEASDNPPFIFLSYYQVLEYFLPMAHKRDAVKALRIALKDPYFDEGEDSSVLTLLNSIERLKQASEEEQLKVLVRDFVREEKLKEFFDDVDVKHFANKGPIAGIPEISLHPKSEPLSVQVAKRIYALRNRIVHAKDDPKYASIPVLLPRSVEANNLQPDVALARVLATEALIHGQG